MKVEVIEKGLYMAGKSGDEPVAVGTVMDIPEIRGPFVGKVRQIGGSAEGKTMATGDGDNGEDLAELREQYEQVTGKAPGPNMKAETMRKHIEKAQETGDGDSDNGE